MLSAALPTRKLISGSPDEPEDEHPREEDIADFEMPRPRYSNHGVESAAEINLNERGELADSSKHLNYAFRGFALAALELFEYAALKLVLKLTYTERKNTTVENRSEENILILTYFHSTIKLVRSKEKATDLRVTMYAPV